MFEDAIYRQSHENVTSVIISRDIINNIKIIFTIENTKRTKSVKDITYINNKDVLYHRTEDIIFKVNKFAHLIDEVPDYISHEQIAMWLNLRMEKL
jgi:hypothetical protein